MGSEPQIIHVFSGQLERFSVRLAYMKLKHLLEPWSDAVLHAPPDLDIRRIWSDSRSVQPGDLYYPKQGLQVDGLQFAQEALDRGASAVVAPPGTEIRGPWVQTPRDQPSLQDLVLRLYQNPSKHFTVVGVTGTNGKTSTCHYIEAFLKKCGQKVGVIGTTQYRWPGHQEAARWTTPAFEIMQWYLHQMHQAQVDTVVMECSSHGIDQGRLEGIEFDVCVFTNLTHEHLDYHHTMEAYAEAKKKLFTVLLANSCKTKKASVMNVDDPVAQQWIAHDKLDPVWTYGQAPRADIQLLEFLSAPTQSQIKLRVQDQTWSLRTPIVGQYNLYNAMAATCVALILGIDPLSIQTQWQNPVKVPGRLEPVDLKNAKFDVIVDYAYTEDALANVLDTLKPHVQGKLWTVFGSGGDRDATRRGPMAKTVLAKSDHVVMTTDNPRTEDPQAILDEMIHAIEQEDAFAQKVHVEVDRARAIAYAITQAQPGDLVLVAGKGHETYQEVHGVRHPFDDRQKIREAWEKMR
jgi:UDP-N-acetylmuramyl-tripeptide synthetase